MYVCVYVCILYPFIGNPLYNINNFLSSDSACDENFF